MGLTLDTWSHHNHLSAVLETAKAVPDCTFILNHIGGPLRSRGGWEDVREQTDAEWREHITALAKLPNIVVKVGGAGMPSMGIPSVEDSWPRAEAPPSSQEMADAIFPFYEHVIREFGADRCKATKAAALPAARCAVASGDCLALRGVCVAGMFESNFPVDKWGVGYRVLWNTFKRIAAKMALSDEEKKLIFHDTAAKVYSV